jgi:hypothetical protein
MRNNKRLLFNLSLIGALILSTSAALADDRWDRRDNDRSWNNSRNNSWNNSRNNSWNNSRNNSWNNSWNNNQRRDNDIRWSLNLHFGSPGYWGNSLRSYSPPPVVVRPAPVIVQPAPVIIQNNGYAPSASLFRDRYGNCYERSYNTLGTELRRELPASACNF